MKTCFKCKTEKELDDFHRSNQTKDGRQAYCKKCRSKDKKIYRDKNKDRINAQAREYVQKNKEAVLARSREYYRKNIEYYNEYHQKYRQKPEVKKRRAEWIKEKYHSDPSFRLHCCFSALMRQCIHKNYKGTFEEVLPYTVQELKQHLENQFDENMTWENYGSYWQVDHIIPRSYFKFDNYLDKEFQKCWALENLRPLEASANASKGNRMILSEVRQ